MIYRISVLAVYSKCCPAISGFINATQCGLCTCHVRYRDHLSEELVCYNFLINISSMKSLDEAHIRHFITLMIATY